jgi:hypothetical protein
MPFTRTLKAKEQPKKAKLDFAVVYNLDEDVSEGYTDWISPLHDHARVSFAIGDSIWGNIPEPRPAPPQKEDKPKTRLKMEDIVPHLEAVNEICSPLAEQILSDHQKGLISSSEGVASLLDTRMTTLLQHQPARVTRGAKIKLQAHRNEEQRESKAQIVTLQKQMVVRDRSSPWKRVGTPDNKDPSGWQTDQTRPTTWNNGLKFTSNNMGRQKL